MRRVLHGDLVTAACALLAVTPDERDDLLDQMIFEAERADRYRCKTGRVHPEWGSGSLASAAMARSRAAEPYLDNVEYAACLILVLRALMRR